MSERKRSRQICIRLTDEEFALWQKKLKASGLSQTDYLVKVLSNSVVKVYTIREDLQPLLTEIRHIGGNLLIPQLILETIYSTISQNQHKA